MNADKKFPGLVGAMLTLAGSFLPWERAGGFLDVVTNGNGFITLLCEQMVIPSI